ncbi:ead/Ea22-like family protein [Enterobacter cloacae]|uniref:Protein of uncharacterized function (DUF551) n=1 Tax=Enterobacter cloacae TaxID=550 RepID=A0A144RRG8_ENTCL|nr:ead/Ea22-like family protein [Enterobacter cloacae]CZW08122.1 Protein of uncharacterised function (DUF551) [Enterobacter cloacae]
MSNIDKRALREAAERAGQNDWEYVYTSDLSAPGRGYITVGGAEAIYCLNRATGGVKQSENVLRYIAAARPEKMLALLDELEAAEKRIAELEALTASMEQEPVAYTCIDALDDVYCGSTAMMGPAGAVGEVPLYAAPQLPQPAVLSVPDGVLKSLLPDAEKPEFWFEHNGKIFFEGVKFNNAVFEACRAAMLQGAEPVSNRDELPVWVACSERMPPPKTGVVVGCWFGRNWATKWATYLPYHPDAHQSGFLMPGGSWTPTHWMPLPAAPQQEVTQALAKGMERYGDAMQKLADSGD